MYERESNMVTYTYISCVLEKMSEENEKLKENLPKLSKYIAKQLDVDISVVRSDAN